MAYSETRIVIGGLAHIPVLIFIANFIKGKFGIKTEETKDTVVIGELVKPHQPSVQYCPAYLIFLL